MLWLSPEMGAPLLRKRFSNCAKSNSIQQLPAPSSRKLMRAQPVDATPSNQLIGQYFTLESRSVWLYSIRPIQGSVFLNQPSRPTFALRTPASRRVEQVLR